MKKILSLVLAAMMLCSMLCVAFAEITPPNVADLVELTEFGDLTLEDMEYDPNPDYDMYTVIYYVLEGAGNAEMIITCSAKADWSEFCLEYSFYAADQRVVCDGEGKIISDLSGFMRKDTPAMLQYIKENAVWSAMPAPAAE